MPTERYLDDIRASGWSVAITSTADGWSLSISNEHGSEFSYIGENLKILAARAWAGEPGDR